MYKNYMALLNTLILKLFNIFSRMTIFANPNEMIKFARDFVKNRIYSLEKDVKYCLTESNFPIQYAPFPALLYCFSTIDLLGSLLEGMHHEKLIQQITQKDI